MLCFPNAKVNIGLYITGKRADGYHELLSCFYPAPWHDALEVIAAERTRLTTSGLAIPGNDNLCLQAYHLLRADFDLPPVHIHLHKHIPIGAGLGGGSADGAFMLKLLNDKFALGLDNERLRHYAGRLGSDCPFFIDNRPVLASGRGEVLTPLHLSLAGWYIAVVYPQLHIDTAAAYRQVTPQPAPIDLRQTLETTPVAKWRNLVKNDFEKSAPQPVHELKQQLYEAGASYAAMSGSGSAVYGLFEGKPSFSTSFPNIIERLR